jgi:hypothetical protein
MMKKKMALLVILMLIAVAAAGFNVWRHYQSKDKVSSKSVDQPEVTVPEDTHKSSEKTTAKNDALSQDQIDQMKKDAVAFYQAAYQKDFTKAKTYMTSVFAKDLDTMLSGGDAVNGVDVVRDISVYTDASSPKSVSNPSVIAKNQEYQITLKLTDSYQAKVGFQKVDATYKVFSFSAQDSNLGNGGYAGSSQKGR